MNPSRFFSSDLSVQVRDLYAGLCHRGSNTLPALYAHLPYGMYRWLAYALLHMSIMHGACGCCTAVLLWDKLIGKGDTLDVPTPWLLTIKDFGKGSVTPAGQNLYKNGLLVRNRWSAAAIKSCELPFQSHRMEEYQLKDKKKNLHRWKQLVERRRRLCVLDFSHLVQLRILVFTNLDTSMQALFALPNEKTFFILR